MQKTGASEAKIEKLISKKLLEKVTPDQSFAKRLLEQATNHLNSAEKSMNGDPEGAYCLIYDASRKSLSAILSMKGLRATSFGGHAVIHDVLIPMCTMEEVRIVGLFDKMRRRRNTVEYPETNRPGVDLERVQIDFETATRMLEWAKSII